MSVDSTKALTCAQKFQETSEVNSLICRKAEMPSTCSHISKGLRINAPMIVQAEKQCAEIGYI